MRIACLGSGSKGNAWLVESGTTRIMLDCGFGVAETVRRLDRLGLAAGDVSGIVVTHEHSDHVRGALPFARKYGCAVWLTHGTQVMLQAENQPHADTCRVIGGHDRFAIGDLVLHPFPVPHDAREPVQYVVSDGDVRWALLTDLGHVTDHARTMLDGCDGLALECNHDVAMLRSGSYPAALKSRILSNYGHLDNETAAGLLACLETRRLRHVVAAHLSEENNTPELARNALAGVLGCSPDWVDVADQQAGLGWRQI